MTKTKTKPPTDAAKRKPSEAEFLKTLGRNAGGSGALVHTALTTKLLASFAPGESLSQQDVCDGLREASSALVAGDTESVERMLFAQMTTLNAVFAQCAARAVLNMGEHLPATESYMRLALKAQAQCARSAEVLGNLRAGPTVFAKQANIAHNQQVNNGPTGAAPRAQETPKPRNELLEANNGERMDAGTQATPARGDTALETVGALHRAENRRRQSDGGGQ